MKTSIEKVQIKHNTHAAASALRLLPYITRRWFSEGSTLCKPRDEVIHALCLKSSVCQNLHTFEVHPQSQQRLCKSHVEFE